MGKMAGFKIPLCLLVLISCSTKDVNSVGAPSELTLDVSLVPPYDSVVEHYIGGKTEMKVEVQFPEATTSAVTIELLPSTNVTIMALGEITVTPPASGSLTKTGSDAVTRHITDETKGQKVQLSTRAVINLGDVTGGTGGASLADYTYTITFEAFVVSTTGLTDNETHWVSAGVEYDNSNNIWVGQIAHYIRTGTQASTKTPSFNMVSVLDLKRMSVTPITFEAFVPYPNSFIAVEAISLSSTNDHLRVISLKCKKQSVDTHFEFYGSEVPGGETYLNYPLLKEYGDDCTLYPGGARRLRVELGNVPNKGSRDNLATGNSDKLQFEAMVNMKGTAVENDEYPFGVGVEIDGTEVWVATMNITASANDPIDFPLGNFVDVDSNSDNANKKIGEGFLSKVPITIPQRGEVTVTYKVETTKNGGGNPGIMVSQAFVADSDIGNNVKCVDVTASYESSIPNGLVNIAYFNITATNHGINETTSLTASEDIIHLSIALATVTGYAVDSANYNVTITSVDLLSINTDSITYTMNGVAAFDTNTNHTFELTSNCSDNQFISEGSTFELLLTIVTQRDSNPESLQIEFPIPANITDGMFVVCGIEVVSIGKNLICFSKEQLLSGANYSTLPDGTHEYVAINNKPACNMGIFSDPEEDKIVLKIKTKYKANVTVNQGEEYWFGIGSKYTSTQIWVAQYPVYGLPIYELDGAGIVTDINVLGTPTSFPGFFKLTRSFNGADFETMEIQVSATTNNGTHTHYALTKPIMAKRIGLITEGCNPVCGVNYDFTYSSFREYVDIFGDDNSNLINQAIILFDNDTSSCLQLPVQGQSPPVFWARINTTILNIDLNSFTISVEGAGISCQRHGSEKVLQVSISYPTSSSVGRFHGDVTFCKNTNSALGSPNMCDFTCMCPNTAECSEIIVFLANSDNAGMGATWSLCGLTALNI